MVKILDSNTTYIISKLKYVLESEYNKTELWDKIMLNKYRLNWDVILENCCKYNTSLSETIIGYMYMYGLILPKSLERAQKCFRIGYINGNSYGYYFICYIYYAKQYYSLIEKTLLKAIYLDNKHAMILLRKYYRLNGYKKKEIALMKLKLNSIY